MSASSFAGRRIVIGLYCLSDVHRVEPLRDLGCCCNHSNALRTGQDNVKLVHESEYPTHAPSKISVQEPAPLGPPTSPSVHRQPA